MKVLLPTSARPAEFAFACELCRALQGEGVQFTLAITHAPLEPHQRACLRSLTNVEFLESTYRPLYRHDRDVETSRTLQWLRDVARDFDVDVVHATNRLLAEISWDRPVAFARTRIAIGRDASCFSPRQKELLIAAADYVAVASLAPHLSWPVFVLGNPPVAMDPVTNLHFLGALSPEDSAAVLGRASIFLHTTSEPGYAVLDAALCGCALVLSETMEATAQWRGAAAFVSRPDDEPVMRALEWLMNDADARADFGQRARALALNYTADKMAAAYLSLYIEASLTTGRPVATHSS